MKVAKFSWKVQIPFDERGGVISQRKKAELLRQRPSACRLGIYLLQGDKSTMFPYLKKINKSNPIPSPFPFFKGSHRSLSTFRDTFSHMAYILGDCVPSPINFTLSPFFDNIACHLLHKIKHIISLFCFVLMNIKK